MGDFKHNYSEVLLLSNQNIKFWNEEGSFELTPMSFGDVLSNRELGYVLGAFELSAEKLQEQVKGFKVNDHYEFFHLILTMGAKKEKMSEASRTVERGLQTLIPNIRFDEALWIDDIFVTKKLFGMIMDVVFLIMGKERISIEEEDDEFTRMEKKAALRAQQIRDSGKKGGGGDSLKDMLAALLYEFPQYKLEDLFKLNIFTVYYLFGYIGKIANYEVSKIAAGNGLVKKHKYFIEK